jgi:hypothetical protein
LVFAKLEANWIIVSFEGFGQWETLYALTVAQRSGEFTCPLQLANTAIRQRDSLNDRALSGAVRPN